MRKLAFVFALLILAIPCQARVITVDDDGPADFNNIQAGINDANDGDTVVVAPGTYTGTGNRDIDFLGKAITVRSTEPNDVNIVHSTIIDCNGSQAEPHRGFSFRSREGPDSVLNGLKIINGYRSWGGAIYCDRSSPTIANCIISDNESVLGGGIRFWQSNADITNCTIKDNKASASGGGIDCWGSPTISNCMFLRNRASLAQGYVGGISIHGNPTITNCVFIGNKSRGTGAICNWYNSDTILTNCTIVNNSSYSYLGSGGIVNQFGKLKLSNCILWGNKSITGIDETSQIDTSPNPNALTIKRCCIQGWTGRLGGTKNNGRDPCLAFPDDYHLMPSSHSIDTGTNNPAGGLPVTDIDGSPRNLDGDSDGTAITDRGAHEYNPDSASIAVSASLVRFTCIEGGVKPDTQALLIRNCGGGSLNWEVESAGDCNWLDVGPTIGTSTGEVNEITLKVEPNGLTSGLYSCILTVQDPNAMNSPVAIDVALHIGKILSVPEDLDTIQAAIDAAKDYDVVVVADGVYKGEGNRDIDLRGKAITVRSENGPENCIIDCNGSNNERHRGFDISKGEQANSRIEGFTITNGCIGGGGGIYCVSSSPTIINCRIRNNTVTGYGGGILFMESCTAVVNCIITDNSAVGVSGKYGEGGGIWSFDSGVGVYNCIIGTNAANEKGGGIYSGGFYNKLSVTNCLFARNTAKDRGGGLSCDSYYSEDLSSLTLTNCTVVGNSSHNGNALACGSYKQQYPSKVQITNCILWDSGDEIWNNDGSTITIAFSNVQGGWLGEGNIDADPCFVDSGYWADACDPNIIVEPNDPNAMWVDGDYHLLSGFPCIDSGDPNYAAGAGETDLDGNPRIVDGDNDGNSVVDMGAYEWMPGPAELIAWLLEDVAELELPSGIENSLEAKLNAALRALEDENENNDAAAVNLLEAFINTVEAQRGKKIPAAEADDLIAAAQEIIELLGGG